MLNIGLSELLLIVGAAILLIRPADYPVVIKSIARFAKQVREMVGEVRGQVDAVMEDSGIKEVKKTTRTIIDLEGKEQEAYDVSDILPKDRA